MEPQAGGTGLPLSSLSLCYVIYQICTKHLLCTRCHSDSFPNINSSNQAKLKKQTTTSDGNYCYYPCLTGEETKDREVEELAQGHPAEENSDESDLNPGSADLPMFLHGSSHATSFPHCPPPPQPQPPKVSSFNVLLVVTLGLIGE